MSNSLTTSSLFGQAPGLAASAEVPKLEKDGRRVPSDSGGGEAIRIHLHPPGVQVHAGYCTKEGLTESGFGGQVFTDMLDQQYADIASKNESLGLADMIAIQLGGGEDPKKNGLRPMESVRRQCLKAT